MTVITVIGGSVDTELKIYSQGNNSYISTKAVSGTITDIDNVERDLRYNSTGYHKQQQLLSSGRQYNYCDINSK